MNKNHPLLKRIAVAQFFPIDTQGLVPNNSLFKCVSTKNYEHFLFVEYLTNAHGYRIEFGVSHIHVRNAVNIFLASLQKNDSYKYADYVIKEVPVLTLFDVGEYMGWPISGISKHELLDNFEVAYESIVEPTFSKIQTNEDFLELLLNDSEPFNWIRTNIVTRLIQVAYLVVETGIGRERALKFDEKFALHISRQLSFAVPKNSLFEYAEDFFKTIGGTPPQHPGSKGSKG